MTPPTWIDAYLEEKEKVNQLEEKNQEIRLDFEFLAETWQENKQSILMGAGTTCMVIGGLLVPLPLVPGWPLLLLGSYCLKLASEKQS